MTRAVYQLVWSVSNYRSAPTELEDFPRSQISSKAHVKVAHLVHFDQSNLSKPVAWIHSTTPPGIQVTAVVEAAHSSALQFHMPLLVLPVHRLLDCCLTLVQRWYTWCPSVLQGIFPWPCACTALLPHFLLLSMCRCHTQCQADRMTDKLAFHTQGSYLLRRLPELQYPAACMAPVGPLWETLATSHQRSPAASQVACLHKLCLKALKRWLD